MIGSDSGTSGKGDVGVGDVGGVKATGGRGDDKVTTRIPEGMPVAKKREGLKLVRKYGRGRSGAGAGGSGADLLLANPHLAAGWGGSGSR